MLRKIIFTLVAIGLLWGFQTSAFSDPIFEESEIVGASCDQNKAEKENHEAENLKLFSLFDSDFNFLKILSHPDNRDPQILQKNFSEVLTSPPNC